MILSVFHQVWNRTKLFAGLFVLETFCDLSLVDDVLGRKRHAAVCARFHTGFSVEKVGTVVQAEGNTHLKKAIHGILSLNLE